ncbi:UNVERIFIED_CONTAM: hypothetical protein Sradi_4582800 [Sesamum radiatum]|uniref:F-box associated beta-propeller type 1 domain-containing protein n=1 Tax=Sesamum radiatum TaxID=300843 RepID=A0AAW2NCK6_SESRA
MTNVYDSRVDSWRIVDTKLSDLDHKPEFNLFFNGAQHWKVTTHDQHEQNSNHYDVGYTILCFDMSSEVFKWISYPRTYYHDDDRKCEALEYGVSESWTKEFVIGPNSRNFDLVPRCCSWQDEWIVLESTGQLAAHAIHANQIKTFQFHGLEKSFRAIIFRESLVSLNKGKA